MMNKTIKTFGYPDTLVKEYKSWVVLLRPQPVTIGSLIIAAKSEATNLGGLSTAEWAEFAVICKQMETLLKETFDAEKFNYLALMMKDPNVHFHFIPRYSKPVSINSHEYRDSDWPAKTELKAISVDTQDQEIVRSTLLKKLNQSFLDKKS